MVYCKCYLLRGKFCSQLTCSTCIFFCFRFVGLSEPVLAEEGNLIAGWKVGQARGMGQAKGMRQAKNGTCQRYGKGKRDGAG